MISPYGIASQRSSDGTSIYIVWRKVSLEEAHGFFEYIIVLDAVNSRHRQSSNITEHASFNKTSINATGLNPELTYTLTMRIAVQNETGVRIEGPTSTPIITSEPIYDNPSDNVDYETPVVNNNVPVITERDYVNVIPKESQQIEPIHTYVNIDNEHNN